MKKSVVYSFTALLLIAVMVMIIAFGSTKKVKVKLTEENISDYFKISTGYVGQEESEYIFTENGRYTVEDGLINTIELEGGYYVLVKYRKLPVGYGGIMEAKEVFFTVTVYFKDVVDYRGGEERLVGRPEPAVTTFHLYGQLFGDSRQCPIDWNRYEVAPSVDYIQISDVKGTISYYDE